MRRVRTRVTEPMADGDEVDSGLEEMDRGAVSKAVRVEPFEGETGTDGTGAVAIFGEQVSHPESSQRSPAVIHEQRGGRGWREVTLRDTRTQQLRRLRPERTQALFRPFPRRRACVGATSWRSHGRRSRISWTRAPVLNIVASKA